MPRKSVTVGAIIGSTLMALSLVGSYGNPAALTKRSTTAHAGVVRLHELGKTAFSDGRYQDAREAFWAAATLALRAGSPRDAAMNWSNAGYSSVVAMQYRPALEDLSLARRTAEASGERVPLLYALTNMASLYLQMGAPDRALGISREALNGPAAHAAEGMYGKLLNQEAQALAMLGRFPEAEPVFREALTRMVDANELEGAARCWEGLGGYYIDAGRYADAEWALSEALRLVRTHHLKAATTVLTDLAKLRGRQGQTEVAEHLFQAALDTHETITPRWLVYYERGLFRLETGSIRPALEDFRESRRLAIRMRADIVPTDRTRVAVENRVSKIYEGLVDAGNRLALATNDKAILEETFDAAEQDRLWSLRSLLPESNDWRSRLPAHYWELLVRFQAAEAAGLRTQANELRLELKQAEIAAGADSYRSPAASPSRHARSILDDDSVLLSFSVTDTGSWLWVVDREHVNAYALPPRDQLRGEVADFTRSLQTGADSTLAGSRIYQSLFGRVPAAALTRKRWLLEPDGPLYELPFAALPAGDGKLLIERAALQSVPGALLMERGALRPTGSFFGIGDPVFNRADSRWRGETSASAPAISLPRLPNTASEVEACARAWGSDAPRLLTGHAANIEGVDSELSASPAIIHFATHVVSAPGNFGSGLIALSLDNRGAIGLLGPEAIEARRLTGSLVVMNGCHSAQGEALPGSGLMGLTRAWIGAGATAVLSTQWDVPDEASQPLIVNFYLALRIAPRGNPAWALREAQLAALHSEGPEREPRRWAGYFLLSRI